MSALGSAALSVVGVAAFGAMKLARRTRAPRQQRVAVTAASPYRGSVVSSHAPAPSFAWRAAALFAFALAGPALSVAPIAARDARFEAMAVLVGADASLLVLVALAHLVDDAPSPSPPTRLASTLATLCHSSVLAIAAAHALAGRPLGPAMLAGSTLAALGLAQALLLASARDARGERPRSDRWVAARRMLTRE